MPPRQKKATPAATNARATYANADNAINSILKRLLKCPLAHNAEAVLSHDEASSLCDLLKEIVNGREMEHLAVNEEFVQALAHVWVGVARGGVVKQTVPGGSVPVEGAAKGAKEAATVVLLDTELRTRVTKAAASMRLCLSPQQGPCASPYQRPDLLEGLVRTDTLAVLARRYAELTPRLRWMVERHYSVAILALCMLYKIETQHREQLAQAIRPWSDRAWRDILWPLVRDMMVEALPHAPVDAMVQAYHADAAADLHPTRFISPDGMLTGLRDVVRFVAAVTSQPGDAPTAALPERAVCGARLAAAELRRTWVLEHAAAFAGALDIAMAGFFEVSRQRRTEALLAWVSLLLQVARRLKPPAGSSLWRINGSSGGAASGVSCEASGSAAASAAKAAAAAAEEEEDPATAAGNDLRAACCGPALSSLVMATGVTALSELDGGPLFGMLPGQQKSMLLGVARCIAAAKTAPAKDPGDGAAAALETGTPSVGLHSHLQLLLLWLEAAQGCVAAGLVRRLAAAGCSTSGSGSSERGGCAASAAYAAGDNGLQEGGACTAGGEATAVAAAGVGVGGGGVGLSDTAGANTGVAVSAADGAAVTTADVVSTSSGAAEGESCASASRAAVSASEAGSSNSATTASTTTTVSNDQLPPLVLVPGRRMARELVLRVAGAALMSARVWLDQIRGQDATAAATATAAGAAATAAGAATATAASGADTKAATRAAAMSVNATNGKPVLRGGLQQHEAIALALDALAQSQQLSAWARPEPAGAADKVDGRAVFPETPRVVAAELAHWRHVAAACNMLPDLVQHTTQGASRAAGSGGAAGPSTSTGSQRVAAWGAAGGSHEQGPVECAKAFARLQPWKLVRGSGGALHTHLLPGLVAGQGDRIEPEQIGRPLQLPLRCGLEGGMLPALERLLRRAGEDLTGPHAAVVLNVPLTDLGIWLKLALSGSSSSSSSSSGAEAPVASGGSGDRGLREAAALVVTYGKLLRRTAAPLLAFADACCGEHDTRPEVARSAAAALAGGDFAKLVELAKAMVMEAAVLLRSWVDCLLPERDAGGGVCWPRRWSGSAAAAPSQQPHQHQHQHPQQQAAAALAALATRQWYPTIASIARRCWFLGTSVFMDDTARAFSDDELRAQLQQMEARVRATRDVLGPVVVAAAREFHNAFSSAREFHLMYGPALELLLPPSQRVSAAERTPMQPPHLMGSAASHQASALINAEGKSGGPSAPPSPASLVGYMQSCSVGAVLRGWTFIADQEDWHNCWVEAAVLSLHGTPLTGHENGGWWRLGGWRDGGWLALYRPADVANILGTYVARAVGTLASSDAPALALVRHLPTAIQLHPRAASVNIAATADALAAAAAPLPPAGELHLRGPLVEGDDADCRVRPTWRPEWLRARADELEALAAAEAQAQAQAQAVESQGQGPQQKLQQGTGRRKQGAPPAAGHQGTASTGHDQGNAAAAGKASGSAAVAAKPVDARAAAAKAEQLQATLASLRQAADLVERLLHQLPPAGSNARAELLLLADEDEEAWWREERKRLEEEERHARKRRKCEQPQAPATISGSESSNSSSRRSAGGPVADADLGAGVPAVGGSSASAGAVAGVTTEDEKEAEVPPLLGAAVWRRVCAATHNATWALQQLEATCGGNSNSSSSSSSSSSSWLKTCSYPGCANLAGDSELGLRLRGCGGGCGAVSYCCRECQVADWKAGHKAACGGRASAGAAVGAAAAAPTSSAASADIGGLGGAASGAAQPAAAAGVSSGGAGVAAAAVAAGAGGEGVGAGGAGAGGAGAGACTGAGAVVAAARGK